MDRRREKLMPRKPDPARAGRSQEQAANIADPEQYQRFLDAAHELGCEENSGRLDEIVRRTATLPPPRASATRKRKKTDAP